LSHEPQGRGKWDVSGVKTVISASERRGGRRAGISDGKTDREEGKERNSRRGGKSLPDRRVSSFQGGKDDRSALEAITMRGKRGRRVQKNDVKRGGEGEGYHQAKGGFQQRGATQYKGGKKMDYFLRREEAPIPGEHWR